MLGEMRRIQVEEVSAEELADVKAYVTGIQPLRLESNDGIASALLDMEFYNLGLDYIEKYPSYYRAVTIDQVRAAARKYVHPERATLVIAGTYAGK